MVSQNTSSYNNVYRFSGKELDEETGLSYFGARYYNPKWSVWLGVDQLWAKYPNISPYVYCAGNPINIIDPDGKRIIFIPGLGCEKGNESNGPYAKNISSALVTYTSNYDTSSQTVDGSHGLFGDMIHVMFNAQRRLFLS